MDCERIAHHYDDDTQSESSCASSTKHERDDLSGMMLNMVGKLDGVELIIIWLMFLFLHTEMACEHIFKRFSGATNKDNNTMTMTMKGTLIASVLMMIVVIICKIVF